MRYTAGVLSSVLLVLAPLSVYSLSCPGFCEVESCTKSPPKCAYGIVKDACNCCTYCGNGPGEQCGGDFNILGVCGKALECISNSANEPSIYPEGVCVWKKKPIATPVQPSKQQQQYTKFKPLESRLSRIQWKQFNRDRGSRQQEKPSNAPNWRNQ